MTDILDQLTDIHDTVAAWLNAIPPGPGNPTLGQVAAENDKLQTTIQNIAAARVKLAMLKLDQQAATLNDLSGQIKKVGVDIQNAAQVLGIVTQALGVATQVVKAIGGL